MKAFFLRRRVLVGIGAVVSTVIGCPPLSSNIGSSASNYRTPFKYKRLVLTHSEDSHAFDSYAVDDPFVFSIDGRIFMTYVGYDGVGYQTGLAESTDLVHWRKVGLILRRNPNVSYTRYNIAMTSILRNDDIASFGPLKKVNGQYLGVWSAYPNPGYEEGAGVIGLARSDDLIHWNVEEPILQARDGAPWEHGGLYKAYLVETNGTYYIFYNAKNKTEGQWHEQIGVATSQDLKSWTRYGGNPIISNGPKGSWDEYFASNPAVVFSGTTWVLFYFGLSRDLKARELLALGSDPYHFTKVNEVLVDVGPTGSVDDTFAHKPSVISWRGDLYHFYCGVSSAHGRERTRGIAVARSRPW